MIEIRNNIVFFDGYCILCNSFIDFLFRSDKGQKLFFGPLQSKASLNIFYKLGYSAEEMSKLDSLVYLKKQRIKLKSDAILCLLFDLGCIYRASVIFYLVPKVLRDFVYDQIALKRYTWFGQRATCRTANTEEKSRILE